MAFVVKFLSLVAVVLFQFKIVHSHVGLTFPAARKYALDFLDSTRTKPPCGMPKGEVRTSIKAGTKFNVTWHLGYPHQGGFRLELLDPNEKVIRELTNAGDNEFVVGDTTAQAYMVDIPRDLECIDCTIRLVRQALEWSKRYLFWSCADVDILQPGSYREDCSGHGNAIAGRCKCDRLYYGERCQYQDECVADADCGRHGKCIDIEATSAPRKQCFCQHGFFGAGCSEESPVRGFEIVEGLYTKREITPTYTLFWRILRDVQEIEIAIRAKGTGYVGIGWRPKSATKSCQKYPKIGDELETEDEEGAAEPEGEPESQPEPDDNSIEEELLEQGSSSRQARKVRKSLDVSIGFVTSSVSSERKRRQAEVGDDVTSVTEVAETTEVPEVSETTAEPDVSGEASAEPEGEPEAEAEAEAEPDHPVDDKDDGVQAEPVAVGKGVTSFTPRGEFHAMDCVDMVIGMARGDASRIWDYYTRDRSTPHRDTFWGGSNDVTGAVGFERDGETTIIFRKKLKSKHFTDHDILNEDMHVIWALGQEHGDYNHVPDSGLEKSTEGSPSIPDFYRPDELKYHGKKNRGVVTMNFFDEVRQSIGDNAGKSLDFCGGEWKFPRDCSVNARTCEYFAQWMYDEESDKVHFTVRSKYTDLWTGIGFSETPQMSLTDTVIGFVESNGRFFIMDMWATSYLMPALEPSQDLTDMEGSLEDGFTTLKFSRARNTSDNQDVAFTNDQAMYFIFPVKGGRFNAVNKKFGKHEETPIPSAEKIFIRPCRTADGKSTFTTTPRPAQIMYSARLKFVDLGELYELPRSGTKEYKELQMRLARSMQDTPLNEVPGFSDLKIMKLKSDQLGEFTADMVVIVDKAVYEAKENHEKSVEQAMNEIVDGGKVGLLSVDPQSLELKSPVEVDASTSVDTNSDSSDEILSTTKLYIIIAAIVALLFIALVQAICTIYKLTRKNESVPANTKDKPSAWKDYSANGSGGQHTNYAFESYDYHPGDEYKRRMMMPPMQQQQPTNGTLPRPAVAASRNAAPLPPQPRAARGPQPTNGGGYSLPRPASAYGSVGSYNSLDRRAGPPQGYHPAGGSDFAPDHYFMPSQRKPYR